MPVTPEYDWEQDDQVVHLFVALKGVCSTQTHLVCSSCCVKLNAPPYFLLLDLFGEVNEVNSSAVRSEKGYTITLTKRVIGRWDQLVAKGAKASIVARRNASLEVTYARLSQASQSRKERKIAREQAASEGQFCLEKQKRSHIEARKEEELSQERDRLRDWQFRKPVELATIPEDNECRVRDIPIFGETGVFEDITDEEPAVHDGTRGSVDGANTCGSPRTDVDCLGTIDSMEGAPEAKTILPNEGEVWDDGVLENFPGTSTVELQGSGEQNCTHSSLVREPLEPVSVQFTRLETPHLPAREQREEELKLFKKHVQNKDKEVDLNMEDQLPVFLKDKGDSMYKQGNFRAAMNAYNRAIDLDPSQMMCFANRAACHLQLGDPRACIADCSTALAELENKASWILYICSGASTRSAGGAPHRTNVRQVTIWHMKVLNMEDNTHAKVGLKKALARVLQRRGIARCNVDELEDAALDLERGLKYDQENEELRENLEEIRACVGPPNVTTLISQGIRRFSKANHAGAKAAFSAALAVANIQAVDKVKALANRAACRLVLEEYEMAISDCNVALKMLTAEGKLSPGDPNDQTLGCFEDPKEGLKNPNGYNKELSRLLCRRGAAHCHNKNYVAGLKDYERALKVLQQTREGNNATELIKGDIAKIHVLLSAKQQYLEK